MRHSLLFFLHYVLVSLVCLGLAVGTPAAAPLQTVENQVVFAPVAIPLSSSEIVNPLRGFYRWRGSEMVEMPEPMRDDYERFVWYDPDHLERSLETAPGVYDFSYLEGKIAQAAAEGRKFAFRVRSMLSYRDENIYVPPDMEPYGWWADTNGDNSPDTYVPDWNHPYYLERATNLLNELGRRYNDDKRIAWIDIGLYGQYGEWTLSSRVDYDDAPEGIEPITQESKQILIDGHVRAFSRQQLVIFLLRSNFKAIKYAFAHPQAERPIGWRVDCLARPDFFDGWLNDPYQWDQLKDRWQVAPVVAEFCSRRIIFDLPDTDRDGLGQVINFHVSAVGNGNIQNWEDLSQKEKDRFVLIGKTAGYRFILSQLTLPSTVHAGGSFLCTSSWTNQGVAPAYEDWDAVLQLRNPQDGTVVWESILSLNLKNLMPEEMLHLEQMLNLSSVLAPGIYPVHVLIRDPQGYRSPLLLAIEGRQADDSFYLGRVAVDTPLLYRIFVPLFRN